MYFVRNNPNGCKCERNRINIPKLKLGRIKEKGDITATKNGYVIRSRNISVKACGYYVSILVGVPVNCISNEKYTNCVGLDLGVKDFAICFKGKKFKNINKTKHIKK